MPENTVFNPAQPLTGTNFLWFSAALDGVTSLDLQHYNITGIAADQVAICTGQVAHGDGAGGVWYWDSGSTETHNVGTIIRPASNPTHGRWKRIYSGPVSVKWFGAKGGNNVADYDAVSAAAAAVSPGAGGTLLFPPGSYRLEQDITFGATVALEFMGGAILCPDTGKTVTILGPLSVANAGQIFHSAATIRFGTDLLNLGGGIYVPWARSGNSFIENVNVKWWGATSGSYNTPPSDSTTAFQSALNAYKSVYVPEGLYVITSITLPAHEQNLLGSSQGGYSTCLRSTIISGAAIASGTNVGNQGIRGIYLSNASNEPSRTSVGISGAFNLTEVFVDQFYRGVAGSIWGVKVAIEGCLNACLYLDSGVSNVSLSQFWLAGAYYGILMDGATRCSFDQGIIRQAQINGVAVLNGARDNTFNDVKVDACARSGIYIAVTAGTVKPRNTTIQSCTITDNGQFSAGYAGIEIQSALATKIANCSVFDDQLTVATQDYGVYLNTSTVGTIVANNLLFPNKVSGMIDYGGSYNRAYGNAVSGSLTTLLPSDDVSNMNGTFVFNKEIETPSLKMASNRVSFGSALPTTGTATRGDIVWNTGASASGKAGWICVTSGSPGTWKAFGSIDA